MARGTKTRKRTAPLEVPGPRLQPRPTPPPPALATLRSSYDLDFLANALVEGHRRANWTNEESRYHRELAKAAAEAFGVPARVRGMPRPEALDASSLTDLIHAAVEAVATSRTSPFGSGLEGRPTAAYLLCRRFRDRFEECDRATTSVLQDLLLEALAAVLGPGKTITNDDLRRCGFDPWAPPPKSDDDW
ncbi:MAG: hypothetical protein K1X89_03980 [Myxococcaceae bacterium]|nr:hypothetical protein [Myxococcaceae bacterium]